VVPPQSEAGPDPGAEPAPGGASAAKIALRDQLLTARRRRSLLERSEDARAIALRLTAAPEVRRAATVAAYVAVGAEPGTAPLLHALLAAGKRVVLPVLLPDGDLDWAAYAGDQDLVSATRGLLEPGGARLGVDAIATADVVLVPGLAVSARGERLGRGGGSYDRALARVPAGTFTCVLLRDEEVGVDVPVQPHDRPVTAAAHPSGITRFAATF
jgi:5-formyltetrahydrofolate cyclo-ligase